MSYRQNDVLIPESSYIRFNDVQLKSIISTMCLYGSVSRKYTPEYQLLKRKILGMVHISL